MRVALCQTNSTVGAFEQNAQKILSFSKKAASLKADLAVFPELVLCGYPPQDLLDREDFVQEHDRVFEGLLKDLAKGAPRYVCLGLIGRSGSKTGRALTNEAILIEVSKGGAKILKRQAKTLLPTYDVFDETRHFQAANSKSETPTVSTDLGVIGLSVCEDLWFSDAHSGLLADRQLYERDPLTALKGVDLLINVSASPFEMNKRARRRAQVLEAAKKTGATLVYVNCVGANDEILFDGSSIVVGKDGAVLCELPAFEEAIQVVDLATATAIQPATPKDIELVHDGLVVGIRDYFKKTGFTKAVLGLSGGIDSAVVAALAARALGSENVLGVSMPSQYSSSHSLSDADALARRLEIEYRVHSIKFIFSTLLMELKSSFGNAPADVTEENIQARLRAITLLALANKRGALVLTTGNKSELAVGYCTTYGDMAGALAPLGDLYKTHVYELARYINKDREIIPKSSLEKPPSAELRPNQKDQDSLPEYEKLDAILFQLLEEGSGVDAAIESLKPKVDRKIVEKVGLWIRNSEFKRRQGAPVLKVTNKAFGIGRRVPVAKAF